MSQGKLNNAWDWGGSKYDTISKYIADAISHCVVRLAADVGDSVLDIATGTGWAARQLAGAGVEVTGVDFSSELLKAARLLSKKEGVDCTFLLADAEELPFQQSEFDKVISTFGVMFCRNPERAASELARVCKPGGRFAMTAWTPDSTICKAFEIFKKYTPVVGEPASFSPFQWGDRAWAESMLGPYFELKFEEGNTIYYDSDSTSAWNLISTCYGPAVSLVQRLDSSRRAMLARDYIDYHDRYKTELGIAVPRKYLVICGVRR
jgi:ubiquinone/menaquinone biosynthesis C-methylase UbiE